MDILAEWSFKNKASPHVGSDKTVLMTAWPQGCDEPVNPPRILLTPPGSLPTALIPVREHKWLGLLWRSDLNLLPSLHRSIGIASGRLAQLTSMVHSMDLPLSIALIHFSSKVEGTMRFGRWLTSCNEEALQLLDDTYEAWAKSLLGGQPWRNGVIAEVELGWPLTGAGRAVVDIALHRSKLWLLPDGDIYKSVFYNGHQHGCISWSSSSLEVLQKWGIDDFPEMQSGSERSALAYKHYVISRATQVCAERRRARLVAHQRPFPYTELRTGVNEDYQQICNLSLSWQVRVGQRAFSRIRLGLLQFGHLQGRQSSARYQHCIICNARTLCPIFHVLTTCSALTSLRACFWTAHRQGEPENRKQAALAILSSHPSDAGFAEAVELAVELHRLEKIFWRN